MSGLSARRSGRAWRGGRLRFVLKILYASSLSLYVDKDGSLKGQMTNRTDEPRIKRKLLIMPVWILEPKRKD